MQVFKLIDLDQSGSIDFEEFSIFFAKVSWLKKWGEVREKKNQLKEQQQMFNLRYGSVVLVLPIWRTAIDAAVLCQYDKDFVKFNNYVC